MYQHLLLENMKQFVGISK